MKKVTKRTSQRAAQLISKLGAAFGGIGQVPNEVIGLAIFGQAYSKDIPPYPLAQAAAKWLAEFWDWKEDVGGERDFYRAIAAAYNREYAKRGRIHVPELPPELQEK